MSANISSSVPSSSTQSSLATTALNTEDRWDPELYEKSATFQQIIALKILEKSPLSGEEKRVLDIGCGDGRPTVTMAQALKDGEILGLDASPSMIEAANKRGSKQLRFQCGDIADCSLAEKLGRFDKIVSFNALHWVVDQEQALRNTYAMLHDHGTVLLQLFSPLKSQTLIAANADKIMARTEWSPYFENFALPPQMEVASADAYATLLKKVGFTDVSVRVEPFSFEQSYQEVVEGLKTWLPYLTALPSDEQKDVFVKELVDLILADTGQTGKDPVVIMLFPWVAEAKKA